MIADEIAAHDVVVYMKGVKKPQQCGFSVRTLANVLECTLTLRVT